MPITTNALDALLYIYNGYDNARWNYVDAVGTPYGNPGGIGNGVSLTYSFLSSRPGYASSDEVNVGVLDAHMKTAAVAALDHIADLVDIKFTKADPQQGQITFATSSQSDSSAWAYAPYFYTTRDDSNVITTVTEDKLGGSVWVDNNTSWVASDWKPGAFGYSVMLHELGHALGLKHPFEPGYNGSGAVLDASLDNEAHTIMSYTYAPRTQVLSETTGRTTLSASTMMMLDIEALQHVYGANTSNTAASAGRSVYRWDTNEELLETIWDASGVDTLDCRNQIFTCRIDLNDGEFSSIGLRRTDAEIRLGFDLPDNYTLTTRNQLYNGADNLGIAKGAVLENAFGGSGNDVITGNGVANRLLGGSGQDRLLGGRGNDRLDGGNGADVLSGQDGNDILAGGGGADRMNGGGGRDVFDYNRITDSGRTVGTADVIAGFLSGTDRIDLSTLDADTTLAGNQAFSFIGTASFSNADASGQLRFKDGVLYASIDADAAAEMVISLPGVNTLSAGDLVL